MRAEDESLLNNIDDTLKRANAAQKWDRPTYGSLIRMLESVKYRLETLMNEAKDVGKK